MSGSVIFWRVCVVFRASVVCWKVCGVQGSGAVGEREISGEDGVDQLALAGMNRAGPPWCLFFCCTCQTIHFLHHIVSQAQTGLVLSAPKGKEQTHMSIKTSLKPPNPTCETRNPVQPSHRIQQPNRSILDFPSIPTVVRPVTLASPAGRELWLNIYFTVISLTLLFNSLKTNRSGVHQR